jgi:hypothetical protein
MTRLGTGISKESYLHNIVPQRKYLVPIGIVPKHDGGWRLIMHLSYSPRQGVNSFIDQEDCSVQYSSFDEIVSIVSDLGKRALLGIRDIKSAFRLLPVHRADFDLLDTFFEEQYYVDNFL